MLPFLLFLQQISLSAKFATEKALDRQIVSVNAFVSSSFQVVAIKTDKKKVKCKNGKRACHSRSILIFAAAAMKLQIEGMVG